jgi:tetratricopeptide (TPR) repeat protein
MVRFQMANLIDDSAYPLFAGAFDLIICRNVLMYLTAEMQRQVAANLCASLRDGGWLAVAPAEAMADWFRSLRPVNAPEAILFRKCRRELPQETAKGVEAICVTPIAPAEPLKHRELVIEPSPPHRPAMQSSLEEATRFADCGALEQARAHCNDLLARDELNGGACLLLSAICSELGDYPTAYDAARRAIYLQPTSAEAHFQLAGVLRNLGQAKRADRSLAIAGRLAAAGVTAAVTGAGDEHDR